MVCENPLFLAFCRVSATKYALNLESECPQPRWNSVLSRRIGLAGVNGPNSANRVAGIVKARVELVDSLKPLVPTNRRKISERPLGVRFHAAEVLFETHGIQNSDTVRRPLG